jgi:hypothetical protein
MNIDNVGNIDHCIDIASRTFVSYLRFKQKEEGEVKYKQLPELTSKVTTAPKLDRMITTR